MAVRVLIIGGYGNFGSHIARELSEDPLMDIIIAGRSLDKAEAFARSLCGAQAVRLDVRADGCAAALAGLRPDIVIHTSGPFQDQGYDVARACIAAGCHYIDLADGRAFVTGISRLNDAAVRKGVTVVSGASSVPCLTAAVADHYLPGFRALEALDYGIAAAQRTPRGIATTEAVLGYVGQPFTTLRHGRRTIVHGWQGLTIRRYRHLGIRLLGYCDVPDLELFPERYPDLKSIRFSAGIEVPFVHLGLWGLSWLVRFGIVRRLEKWASPLLSLSRLFDGLGSTESGFHMTLTGLDWSGRPKKVEFELTARSGDGPYIPCTPAILLTRELARGGAVPSGASPCLGLIDLRQYLDALEAMNVSWFEA